MMMIALLNQNVRRCDCRARWIHPLYLHYLLDIYNTLFMWNMWSMWKKHLMNQLDPKSLYEDWNTW